MRRRNAFTLLEILLAMVIAVMVLAAVYSFVGYQLTQAQAGREVIERTTLSRAILSRIDTDVRATITLNDPGRFRLAPDVSGDTAAASTTAATTTSTTTTGAGTAGTSSPSTASTASSASSPSSPSASSATTGASGLTGTVALPLGVIGSSTQLSLFVSRLPSEVLDNTSSDSPQTSDLRRISYWMGGEGSKSGLCRMEVRLVTSEDATNTDPPTGDVEQYLYAPEVKELTFQYFDGTTWQDSWDSTTPGPDQATPQGSPRAISIKIGVQPQRAIAALDGQEPKLKYYRHVIPIPTANGKPLNRNPEGGTTSP